LVLSLPRKKETEIGLIHQLIGFGLLNQAAKDKGRIPIGIRFSNMWWSVP
jgi:hypothetical protein